MNRLLSCFVAVASASLAEGSHLQVKPNVAPVVSSQIADYSQYRDTLRIIGLSAFFSDPDASAAARLVTPLGTMNFTLDGQTAPITVANFLKYVNSGRYFKFDARANQQASLFFHRSVPGFVIQSGGFLGTVNQNNSSGDLIATEVASFGAIQNEPVISNTQGTIAMAKLGGNPNSATSQWFINLANNSHLVNQQGTDNGLDVQNGGFTVFGRVAGSGMSVADAIAVLPRVNAGAPFDTLPVRNYTSPNPVRVPNLVSIPEFTQISPFTFSASSNNTAVATVAVSGTDLLVSGFQLGSAQITVTATDLDGAAVTQSFNVNIIDAPGRLRNIATRANFPDGDEVLIGGFIIRGGTSKRLAVRAIGPSLANQGVANALADPIVELRDGAAALVADNNNWVDSPDRQLLTDIGLAPSSDKEAALITTVPSSDQISPYTAIVRSATGTSGVGLVEVYDLESGPGSTILNLSTRGEVGTGGNVLIGGFIIRGTDSRRLVVRALGPSLANLGVTGVLPDPTIELRNIQGTLIDSNNDWQTHPAAAEIQSQGVAPQDAKESAVIATLPSGEYTATIAGAGNQPTGVASVEIYQVQ